MKKTLIALMALASVAAAETDIFNLGGSDISTSNEDITIVSGSLNSNGVATQSATIDETSVTLQKVRVG